MRTFKDGKVNNGRSLSSRLLAPRCDHMRSLNETISHTFSLVLFMSCVGDEGCGNEKLDWMKPTIQDSMAFDQRRICHLEVERNVSNQSAHFESR